MPKRKLTRRFEPRYGVSQSTLELEATYLGREVDDYLVLSITDLEEKLAKIRKALDEVQRELFPLIDGLPERHRLAVQNMVYRDFFQMAALYRAYLRSAQAAEVDAGGAPPTEVRESVPLPFREFLFGDS
jgi:hypothetical protein